MKIETWVNKNGMIYETEEGSEMSEYFNTDDYTLLETREIAEPKRKVKKSVTRWVNVYPTGPSDVLYSDVNYAELNREHNRIACVPVLIEWEVEE